jgi:HTH-type transcriptional regulator/antitoxin HigA
MSEQMSFWNEPESVPGRVLPPGEYIKRELERRKWSQADLAAVIQRPLPTVNEIIKGKRAVTPEMAIVLGRAFSNSAELWAHREVAYRLSLAKAGDKDTESLAKIYALAPIKDLQRRGWINPKAETADELSKELLRFTGGSSLSGMQVPSALAKQTLATSEFSNAQRAWLMQSSHVARKLNVRRYRRDALEAGMSKIRKLSTSPESAARVPICLAELGVRLVVIEDLPRTRIDGAAFFLDGNEDHPVIALSLRFDRMDCFWHTLAHELRHILNKDPFSLDSNLFGEDRDRLVDQIEQRADSEAAHWLVPEADTKSFVLRAKPWFAKEAITQFSGRMGVHPSIVIGNLQHIGVINWDRYSDVRPKIREHVLSTATCDGYGKRNH